MKIAEIAQHLHAGHVPPKPLNGKPARYSATTLKSLMACQRRHYFEQVVGIDAPVGPALLFGTKVHAHLERYLKHGIVPRVGPNAEPEERIAATGLKHLPMPGTPGMQVEAPFSFVAWPNGPTVTGTQDLFVVIEAQEDADEGPETADLYDHKTTGDYSRYARNGWALSPDDAVGGVRKYLRDDPQLLLYARALMMRFRVRKGINSKWVYYNKNGLPAVPVSTFVAKERVQQAWHDELAPLVELVHHQHTTRPSLAQVPGNEEHCDAFGGCPHRAYCVDYRGPRANQEAATGEGERTVGKLADSLMKEAKEKDTKPAKGDAPPMNPPAPSASPFQTVKEATAPQAAAPAPEAPKEEAPKKGKLAASVAAGAAIATVAASKKDADAERPSERAMRETAPKAEAEAPKAAAPVGAGFNLFVGCEPVKGAKRETMLVADLVSGAVEALRQSFEKAGKDWNEALRFGEVQKRVMDLIAQTVDKDPALLGGKNVRAPLTGLAAEVAVNVLAPRATSYIQATGI